MNLQYTEYPWPHFHGSLDESFYGYVNDSWETDESEKKWNKLKIRSNIVIKNKDISDELTRIGNHIITESESIFSKYYPKLGRIPEADNAHHLFSENPPFNTTIEMRKLHLDNGNKMVTGLWYFKHPDDCGGADLVLYNPITKEQDVISYDTNKIILFPNLPISWHTITNRHASMHPRRFVTLVMESSTIVLDNYKLKNFKDTQTYEETVNYYE